jgi:hypothetical protein
MGIISVFYAAFGYLALLAALFWGMLFVGDGSVIPNMDYGTADRLQAICTDLALLSILALLHRVISRSLLSPRRRIIPYTLERSTSAWVAALVLVATYLAWQPLPQILWSASGWTQVALAVLFYLAWTLVFIGVFLANHLDIFEIGGRREPSELPDLLRQPMYAGVVLAVWAAPVMTVGHLLLATSVTAYLLFDAAKSAHRAGAPRRAAAPGRFVSSGSITEPASTQAIRGMRPAKDPLKSLACATRIGPSSPAAPHDVSTRP